MQIFDANVNLIGYIIQGIVGLVGVWMVKTVQALAVEVRSIRVALFGMQGNNGINSNVEEALEKLERHQDMMQELALHIQTINVHRCPLLKEELNAVK